MKLSLQNNSARMCLRIKRQEINAYLPKQVCSSTLREHPTTGTGFPERLKGDRKGQWSRRINQKHRLIYEIYEDVITVLLLT